MKKITKSKLITYGLVIAAFAVLYPLSLAGKLSNSFSGQLVPICSYIILALSLNLCVGILGELSLGHAGFMSIGAFTGAIVSQSLASSIEAGWLRLIIALIAGGVLAGIAGLLIGIPVLRLKGDYLAIVTLAFGEIIKSLLNLLYVGKDAKGLHFSMTDAASLHLGEGGIEIVKGPMGAFGISKVSSFLAGFIIIIAVLTVIFNLISSKTGRAVMSIRDNRIAAESVGINVTKYKMTAFIISAAIAGIGGALYGLNFSTFTASKFNYNTSILILVFVVLGGLGNMCGSIISASVLTILPELLREFQDYRMLVYAVVLIVVMLLRNNEQANMLIMKAVSPVKKLFSKKSKEVPEDE